MKKILIALYTSMFLLLFNSGMILYANNENSGIDSSANSDYIQQCCPKWDILKQKINVKGIYMTGHTAAEQKRLDKLLGLVSETELNAVVIDVKNDDGIITYKSGLSKVKSSGSDSGAMVRDIDTVMKKLKDKKIYPIARIVTFKDRKAANKFPQLAVKNNSGGIWRDRNGAAWLNPYNTDAWEYIVDIAEEAASKGFKEIQFDYVRFPTDGDICSINYGSGASGTTKAAAIADFLKYADKRLGNKGIVVSADVFGLVTTVSDDMNIGQHLESIAQSVDVICPMVYPSHYANGSYGVGKPDFEPYKIVNKSMAIAQARIDGMTSAKKAVLRPWLQDFTASYLPEHQNYGPAQVRAQISATYDAGVKEWLLWNAGNRYTRGALN